MNKKLFSALSYLVGGDAYELIMYPREVPKKGYTTMTQWSEEDNRILRELYEDNAAEREIILVETTDAYTEAEKEGDVVGMGEAEADYMEVVGETEGLYDLAVHMGAIEEPEDEMEEE